MKLLLPAAVLVLNSGAGLAHDVFLVSERDGDTRNFELRIHDGSVVEKMAWKPDRTKRVWVQQGDTKIDLPLLRESDTLNVSGGDYSHAAFWSHPAAIELTAQQFDDYLAEEHLDQVLSTRAGTDRQQVVSERYSRSLKIVLGNFDQTLGLPLELSVASDTPDIIVVTASFKQQPLAGLWIDVATERGDVAASGRTNADGTLRFADLLDQRPRLLLATHLHPLPGDDSVDYESWWAATTFDPERLADCQVATAVKPAT